MKHFLTVFVGLLVAAPAFGKTLKCVAADGTNRNRVDVPITVIKGAVLVKTKMTRYNGYNLSVRHQVGDQFDGQTVLTIAADDVAAQSYNLSEAGLYQLLAKDLFVQCWFE